jgi:hypothetical protein
MNTITNMNVNGVDAVTAANTAAEAVRALNHATIASGGGRGYEWPGDVDAVVAELHLTAARMDQALEQARRWLNHAHADQAVGHDDGGDVDTAVLDADLGFVQAASAARQLAGQLASLRAVTAHLTGITIPPPEANDGR